MTFLQIVKLLLQPEKWELVYKNKRLNDMLVCREKNIYFSAEASTVFFKDESLGYMYRSFATIYMPNPFVWFFIIRPLSLILLHRVKKREMR